jgi:hypothetical protein
VIVCVAGKFGERWAEIAKAYGLDANVLTVPYGEVVGRPEWKRAGRRARHEGRFRASFGNLHRRGARRARHGRPSPNGRDLRGGCHHRARHHAARYRRLGARRGDRRIAEGLHDSARAGVYVGQPEGLEAAETATLPHYYFNLKKEKKSGDAGESSWTPATSLILALAEALKYVKQSAWRI